VRTRRFVPPSDAAGAATTALYLVLDGELRLTTEDGENTAAVALGRMGGKARAEGMTAKRRAEIAKKTAEKRWGPKR